MSDQAPQAATDADPPVHQPPPAKVVDHSTFKAVTRDRDEWKSKASEYESQIQALTERTAAAERAEAEWRAKEAAWGEERTLLGAGITDAEDADLVRYHYGRINGDAKPKTIADYLAGLKAEGAAIPKGLSHLFGKPPPDATASTSPAPAQPRPKAGGDGTPPPSAGSVTAQAIRDATEHGQRTGDWTRFHDLAKANAGRKP